MTNVVKKQTCIEWTVQTSATYGSRIQSENFTFQGCKCHFECFAGYPSYNHNNFYFNSEKKVKKAVDALVVVDWCSTTSLLEKKSFEGIGRTWENLPYEMRGYLLTFKIIIEGDRLEDEKYTQMDLMSSLETGVDCISSDFGELLKSGEHSDVQLQCKDGDIAAHKAILAARSQAFSDMFKENTRGLLNLLATTETSLMKLCVEYIYKGKISKLPTKMVPDLYDLGHDLKIPTLKKMCADLMISNSSKDNYIPYLVLADKHNDKYFKCGLLKYISNHVDLLIE